MSTLAKIISWVFLPILMPIYGLLLVMFIPSTEEVYLGGSNMYNLSIEVKRILLMWYVFFVTVAPAWSFYVLYKLKVITTLEMDSRKERFTPIIIQVIFTAMLYAVLKIYVPENLLPKFIFALPFSGILLTVGFFFLTLWKKVSIHAAGAGILTGFVFSYAYSQSTFEIWVLMLALILSGIVMSARLYLEKHTLFEVVLGWLFASFLTFGVNYLY